MFAWEFDTTATPSASEVALTETIKSKKEVCVRCEIKVDCGELQSGKCKECAKIKVKCEKCRTECSLANMISLCDGSGQYICKFCAAQPARSDLVSHTCYKCGLPADMDRRWRPILGYYHNNCVGELLKTCYVCGSQHQTKEMTYYRSLYSFKCKSCMAVTNAANLALRTVRELDNFGL
jgi:hypothetical protein